MLSSPSDSVTQSQDELFDARNLQNQNNRLRQENRALVTELDSLKKQFNEATEIITTVEKLREQNQKLSSDLRKVSSERDDLKATLELKTTVISELRAQVEQERAEIQRTTSHEIAAAKNSAEKEKNELLEKQNKAAAELEATKKLLKNVQNDYSAMNKSVNEAITVAQDFFVSPFKNINQVIDHMKIQQSYQQKKISNENANLEKKNNELLENLNDAKRQIKLIKQKAKDERKARKKAEDEVDKLQNLIDEEKNKAEMAIRDYENAINEMKRKMEMDNIQKKNIQDNLENKINELTNRIEEEQNKSKNLQNSPMSSMSKSLLQRSPNAIENSRDAEQLKDKVLQLTNKLKESQASVYSLKKQNGQLIIQLNEFESIKEDLRRKQQLANEEKEKLIFENDQLKSEISQLSLEKDDLNELNQNLISQVQAAKSSFAQSKSAYSEIQAQNEKLQSSILILETKFSKQKDEISELISSRNNYVKTIQQQQSSLAVIETSFSSLKDENSKLKIEIQKLTDNRRSLQFPNNNDIPQELWLAYEYPKQLRPLIYDIASNGSLPTTTKLKNILGNVVKFYNSLIDETEQEKELEKNNISLIVEKIDRLMTSLAQIMNDSTLSGESFLSESEKRTQAILNFVNDLQSSHIEFKISKAQLQNEVSDLLQKLDAQSVSDATKSLLNMKDSEKRMKDQLDNSRQKIKKLSKTIKALRAAAQQEANNAKAKINSQKSISDKLQEENAKLKGQIQQDEEVIGQLSTQLSSMQYSSFINPNNDSTKKPLNKNNHENKLQSILDAQRADFEKAIKQKDFQIKELIERSESAEKEANQYRKVCEILKSNKNEKDVQIQSLMNQMDEREKELRNRSDYEKQSIREQFEKVHAQIKSKNTQLRELVANISGALNDSEERNKSLLSINAQLSIDNQVANTKIEAFKEEQVRSKQLSDARLKALELSLSTQHQMEIEEERTRCDEQKRQIYTFVATQFSSIVSETSRLNEESFKSLVSKCSDELKRLYKMESTLKRTLGLHANESIEDSVSRLLVSIYKMS